MNTPPKKYSTLISQDFAVGSLHKPESISLEDPATLILTDFTTQQPATISSAASIDVALEKMKKLGVRLLLVLDHELRGPEDDARVIGQITACDIMGDRPPAIARSSGLKHSEISVKMVMTPESQIQVVDWQDILIAKVGHVLATMHDHHCCHILIVEDDAYRGVISLSEITKHMDHFSAEPAVCAHSVAELVRMIG